MQIRRLYENIFGSLREHAVKIIKFKNKKNEIIDKSKSRNHVKMQKYVIFVKKV